MGLSYFKSFNVSMALCKWLALLLLLMMIPSSGMERMQQMLTGAICAGATSLLFTNAFVTATVSLVQPTQIPMMIKMISYSAVIAAPIAATNPFWMPEWHPKPILNSVINGCYVGGFVASCAYFAMLHHFVNYLHGV